MKFSTQADVHAPAEETFRAFSDFNHYAGRARERGVEVERLDHGHAVGRGLAWRSRFSWNGSVREMRGEIVRFDPPLSFAADLTVGGLEGRLEVEVAPVKDDRSRVRIGLELTPATMSARILLKSLRLAKARLDDRFAAAVRAHADGIGHGH